MDLSRIVPLTSCNFVVVKGADEPLLANTIHQVWKWTWFPTHRASPHSLFNYTSACNMGRTKTVMLKLWKLVLTLIVCVSSKHLSYCCVCLFLTSMWCFCFLLGFLFVCLFCVCKMLFHFSFCSSCCATTHSALTVQRLNKKSVFITRTNLNIGLNSGSQQGLQSPQRMVDWYENCNTWGKKIPTKILMCVIIWGRRET